jgi:hypothetical protein
MTVVGREQFTLECPKCGRSHSGSMSWLQSNDVLVCEGCGAKTPVDKDAGSWSSSSAIRLRPHRSGQAAFPHPALPGSHPRRAALGVQG